MSKTYSCIDCPHLYQEEDASKARYHAHYNNHCVIEDEDDDEDLTD